MVKKNIVKKKACAATSESKTSIKPRACLDGLSISCYKPSKKPVRGGKCIDYKEWLLKKLQDQELAVGYLNTAMEDEDSKVFLIAMKDVLMAQNGGISEVAKKTKLNRQNLYRMLSSIGNPRWNNLKAIFDYLGYKISLERKK